MPPKSSATAGLDALLRGVSRSFYLSIRLLPRQLRAPVATAYLLARTTDTVADVPSVPAQDKRELLGGLGRAIEAARAEPALFDRIGRVAQAHAQGAERELLLRLPQALGALERLNEDDRHDVRAVLSRILRGQDLDVRRFGDPSAANALPDAAALREYAYLVAGCVGEFWTDVCARHITDFSRLPAGEMRTLGRSFGTALQLVNIVRDARDDLAAGRCYFPADELAAQGLLPQAILREPGRFMPVWQRWQGEAAQGLADGMAYAQALNSRRIRAAVALPALIGRDTLARLRAAGPAALAERIKVPRSEVRALLLRIAIGLAGRGTLQAEWDNRAR